MRGGGGTCSANDDTVNHGFGVDSMGNGGAEDHGGAIFSAQSNDFYHRHVRQFLSRTHSALRIMDLFVVLYHEPVRRRYSSINLPSGRR